MTRYGLLIDYDMCCGCHTCEIACQKAHGYPPETWGIKLGQVGPYDYRKDYGVEVYEFVPIPTKLCDLCEARRAEGKEPTCTKHCYTGCMKFGPLEELAKDLAAKPRQAIFAPQ